MKISYCGIGNMSFVDDEETFVAEVMFQTKDDDRLTGMPKLASHDIELTIRIKGDRAWPFDRIQSEILTEAVRLLGLAHAHIAGATLESLRRYNAESDQEQEAANKARIAGILSKP